MVRVAFPVTLRKFQLQFATEEACQEYLAVCRWPEGYKCPRCGNTRAYVIVKQKRWQCAACRHQVSLTSGTILHNTKTPLTVWFWAAYLMATDKRGLSALLLQRQLGLRRYETAWLMLHKLRRAMINFSREPLHGDVEIDETWVGGPQPGIRGTANSKEEKQLWSPSPLRSAEQGRVAFESKSSQISGRPQWISLSNGMLHRVRRSTQMASGLFRAWTRPESSTLLAIDPRDRSSATGQAPQFHWQIEPLETYKRYS